MAIFYEVKHAENGLQDLPVRQSTADQLSFVLQLTLHFKTINPFLHIDHELVFEVPIQARLITSLHPCFDNFQKLPIRVRPVFPLSKLQFEVTRWEA